MCVCKYIHWIEIPIGTTHTHTHTHETRQQHHEFKSGHQPLSLSALTSGVHAASTDCFVAAHTCHIIIIANNFVVVVVVVVD